MSVSQPYAIAILNNCSTLTKCTFSLFTHIKYVGERKSNIWYLSIRRSTELLTNFINCEKFLPWRAAWMRQTHSLVVLTLDCFLYHQEAIPRDNNLFHTHPLRKILFGDIKEPKTKIKNSIKAHDKTCLTLQLFKQLNGWIIT